jgi:hypothetical protein
VLCYQSKNWHYSEIYSQLEEFFANWCENNIMQADFSADYHLPAAITWRFPAFRITNHET